MKKKSRQASHPFSEGGISRWRTIVGPIAIATLAASCVPTSPSNERLASSVVLTKHAPGVNFGTFKTFFLRPEIRELTGEGMSEPIADSIASPLLAETKQQLVDRGFQAADTKESADLAVEMVYINTQWVATSCYSWWDSYYWGYPGYGYYPYYGSCSAATWQTHTLATTIVDLTSGAAPKTGSIASAFTADGAADAAAPGPGKTDGAVVHVDSGTVARDGGRLSGILGGIWFAGIYGVVYDTNNDSVQQGLNGIDQSFAQSPYLVNLR